MADAIKCTNPRCENGRIRKTDFIHAKTTIESCPVCNGTGYEFDPHFKKDGLYVEEMSGRPFWIEWYENDALLSWAKIRVTPVMKKADEDGSPVTVEKIRQNPGKFNSHLTIEIDHIETKKDRRRKGLATNVVQQMMGMFGGEVKYIVTGWGDSSAASRSMLMKLGFEREAKALVWNRDKKKG